MFFQGELCARVRLLNLRNFLEPFTVVCPVQGHTASRQEVKNGKTKEQRDNEGK